MLSFALLIACNLLVERIPSLSGPATHGNLRNPEVGDGGGEEEWSKEGRQKKKPGEADREKEQSMEVNGRGHDTVQHEGLKRHEELGRNSE